MNAVIDSAPASALEQIDALLPIVAEWQQIANWLEEGKAKEKALREQLAKIFFPEPREGVNKVQLPDGRVLKLDHKINRSIDEPKLDAVMAELPEDSPYRNVGVLVRYRPEIVMNGFRTLPEDQARIFAQAYVEKPGLPALELLEPKTTGEGSAPDWPAENRGVPHADIEPRLNIPDASAAGTRTRKHPVSGRPGNKTAKKGAKARKNER